MGGELLNKALWGVEYQARKLTCPTVFKVVVAKGKGKKNRQKRGHRKNQGA